MKKFRGKKRYFSNLKKEQMLESYDFDFSDDSWFNFWHTHLDFIGRGNEKLKYRKPHIKASFNLMKNLDERLKKWGNPYQIWIEISKEDSSSDAVFVHSNNPSENNFPFQYDNLIPYEGVLPKFLENSFDVEKFMISTYEKNNYEDELDETDYMESLTSTETIFVIQPLSNKDYPLRIKKD